MNQVFLHGRLTADPEMRTANSGNSIAGFTIAVDRMPDKDGNKQTDFIRCSAFGKTAEMIQRYWCKGKEIIAEGSLRQNDYEKDGIKHSTYQVIVNRAHFCGSKSDSNGGAQNQNTTNGAYNGNNGGYNAGYQQNGGGFSAPAPQNNNGGFNGQTSAAGYQQGAQNAGYNGGQQMPLNGNPMGYPQYNTAQSAQQAQQAAVNSFASALSDGEPPF